MSEAETAQQAPTAACPKCGEQTMTYNEYRHSAGTHGTYVCHAPKCDYYHRVAAK